MAQETIGTTGRGFTRPKQMGSTTLFIVLGVFVLGLFGFYMFGSTIEPGSRIGFILLLISFVCLGLWIYGQTWRAKEGYFADASGAQPFVDASGSQPFVDASKSLPSVMSSFGSQAYPYVTDSTFPINGVDDYEYNMVFQNEGDRAMTKQTRDTLMNKYPRDWSVMPSSSELFQQGLAAFRKEQKEPFQDGASPYTHLDGPATPPDTQAAEESERQILQTYVPQSPQSLTTYDAADAKELVNRVYGAKGLIADMRQTQPNVFTIIGTRKKDEKIVYEDEVPADAPASNEAVPAAGEGVIHIPAAATTAPGVKQDMFFDTDAPSRQGRWDFSRWTPGLERAFAPTQPQTNWF